MLGAVLWQVKADGSPAIRCVLERWSDGRYRLHLLKGKQAMPLIDHDFPDRHAALQASITIYRKLKDNGFHDQPKSVQRFFAPFFFVGSYSHDPAWETAVLKAHGHTPVWMRNHSLSKGSRATFAGIDLHFHDLRHEAGSRLLEAGWPLHNVAHMLGHANIAQTSTYLNATRIGLQDSMRRLDDARCNPVANETTATLRLFATGMRV